MIRLEPFRESGSAPAKPPSPLGSLSGHGVAGGLSVGRAPAGTTYQYCARLTDRRRFEASERHTHREISSYALAPVDALLLGALAGALFGLLAVAVRWGLSRGVPAEVGATVTSVIGFAVIAAIAVV